MRNFRVLLAAADLLILANCAQTSDRFPDASIDVIESATYRHDGPAKLTLYTMINNRSGEPSA